MAESAAVEFRIDRRSGVATYMQIVQQTKQALRLGVLRPGDRLPTAREVVEATAINPNTVLKAYRELEREDWPKAAAASAPSSGAPSAARPTRTRTPRSAPNSPTGSAGRAPQAWNGTT